MKKSRKKLLASIAACILAGTMAFNGTMAYLTDTEGAVNIATVGKVNIDLEEPGYPGNDSDEVKSIIPNQEIIKDPQVENTGDNSAIVYLKVDVPQETFTELGTDGTKGETKLQDLFALKGLSENWELIKTEASTDADTAKTKTTYVYAYRKTLDKGTKTDKLFECVQMKNAMENDLSGHVEDIVITACAIQATDIPDVNLVAGEDGNLSSDSLKTVFDIFMKQSGDKINQGGQENATVLGTITYNLDGGTMADENGTEYTKNDYGKSMQFLIKTKPEKAGYVFKGWEPETLSSNSNGDVSVKAVWIDETEVLGRITYDFDGGTAAEWGDFPEFYTAENYDNPMFLMGACGQKDYSVCIDRDPSVITSGTTGDIVVKIKYQNAAALITGQEFNRKIKKLLKQTDSYNPDDYRFIQGCVELSDVAPDISTLGPDNILSDDGEKYPVYAWISDGKVNFWSEAELWIPNQNADYMWSEIIPVKWKLSNINFEYTTDEITSRKYYCSNNPSLGTAYIYSFDLGGDQENYIYDVEGTYEGCKNVTEVEFRNTITTRDGSKIYPVLKNMKHLFYGCTNLTKITFENEDFTGEYTVPDDADITDMLNLKGDGTATRTAGNTLTIKNAPESFKKAAQKCNLGFDDVQLVFED